LHRLRNPSPTFVLLFKRMRLWALNFKIMQKLFVLFFVACGLALANTAHAQAEQPVKLLWYTLTSIPLDGTWKPNQEPPFPIFPESLKKLDGKLVSIEGYTIPLDPSGNQITLSANPYSACFFCGKAGPASIMAVLFSSPQKGLHTDDYITVSGRLRLNATDPSQPYFTLEHAEYKGKK
jgi:hypothetical protein